MTIRVGIVGCGFIGMVHSVALGAVVRAGLVDAAVTRTCDIDADRAARLAEPHGAVAGTDPEALVDAVDAVWVCTWTADHRAVVEAAVDRGRAVFCEKPLAPTLDDCEHVARLLEQVPHQVGLVLRHAPVFAAAADAVSSGRHGRPLATLLRDDQFFPTQGYYASEWRSDVARAGGGTLLEHSIHDVDVLTWILGRPASVRADVATRFGHAGIDDVAVLTLGYDDGSHATLLSVWHQVLSRGSNRRLEVFCDDAYLWADDDHLGPLHVETSEDQTVVATELPEWANQLDLPDQHLAPIVQYAAPTKAFLDGLAADGGSDGPSALLDGRGKHAQRARGGGDAIQPGASNRPVRIALGDDVLADGRERCPLDADAIQRAGDDRLADVHQVGPQDRQHVQRLGIAEARVVLDQADPAPRDHEPAVEDASVLLAALRAQGPRDGGVDGARLRDVGRRYADVVDADEVIAWINELAAPFDMSLQAVSRHIQVLVRAGLVRQERSGRISRCSLDVGPIYAAAVWLNRYSKYWQAQFDALLEWLLGDD